MGVFFMSRFYIGLQQGIGDRERMSILAINGAMLI